MRLWYLTSMPTWPKVQSDASAKIVSLFTFTAVFFLFLAAWSSPHKESACMAALSTWLSMAVWDLPAWLTKWAPGIVVFNDYFPPSGEQVAQVRTTDCQLYSNISQILMQYKWWGIITNFILKCLGVCYWYVKIPQCGYMEHGLECIAFYYQNHVWQFVLVPPAGSWQSARSIFETHLLPRAGQDQVILLGGIGLKSSWFWEPRSSRPWLLLWWVWKIFSLHKNPEQKITFFFFIASGSNM